MGDAGRTRSFLQMTLLLMLMPLLIAEITNAESANSATDVSPPKLPFRCGDVDYNRGTSGRIRERRVGKKSLPWMALIGETRESGADATWFCGGALINTQWILTAAHCIMQSNATAVRLGVFDIESDSKYQNMEVAEVIIHPDFSPPSFYQDLALIRLRRPVKFNDNDRHNVGPVCLPWGTGERSRNLTGETLLIAGWGAMFTGGELSTILLEAQLTVFESNVCDRSYSAISNYERSYPKGIGQETLCVGDPTNRGRDACMGDSGGGAFRRGHAGYVIEGIVSTGFGCGKRTFPGLYVRVTDPINLAWIKGVAFAEYQSLPDIPTLNHPEPRIGPPYIFVKPSSERKGCGKLQFNAAEEGESIRVRRVARNHWPWLALIAYSPQSSHNNDAKTSFRCSGFLINDQWVVTSAFCLDLAGFDVKYVRLGENDIGSNAEGIHEDAFIAEIFQHPQYEYEYEPKYRNLKQLWYDVGLIKLKTEVKFKDMISPVCLPLGKASTNIHPGDKVIAAGFGATMYAGNISDVVQDVELVVMDKSVCENIYSKRKFRPHMLCIGDPTDRGQDTCQGDAGAPVVREVDGAYVAEGIVSFGRGCGMKDTPAVYTRVDYPAITQWIMNVAFTEVPTQVAWRDDYRCGLDHLAPNGQPAQCDPNGQFPCCSVYGWCGHTGDHCECTECVDHRVRDTSSK